MIAVLLKRLEPKLIFVDDHFLDIAKGALEILSSSGAINHTCFEWSLEYESFLARGTRDFEIIWPNDECDPIFVTYTSGTTSTHPKGVVYSHRGAYLNALASILLNHMAPMPVYLWEPYACENPSEILYPLKHGQSLTPIKDYTTLAWGWWMLRTLPHDAKTLGKVMFRGNTVMNGYLKDLI
nr:probable acyl-activating enzyme 1, peroxisomal [Ipomoea batatas]